MTRTSRTVIYAPVTGVLALAASIVACTLFSCNVTLCSHQTATTTFVPPGEAEHLYSGVFDVLEKDTAEPTLSYHRLDGMWAYQSPKYVAPVRRGEMPTPAGESGQWQYTDFGDGSLEFLSRKADGKTNLANFVYFPLTKGEEEFAVRHLRFVGKFSNDGKTMIDGTSFWFTGLARQRDFVDAEGRRHVIAYAQDGVTKLSERLFNKASYAKAVPTLKSEHRWLDNARHSEIYVDEQNGDDTRTIVARDENGFKLWQAHWGKNDYIYGTVVDGYHPGTTILRYHSESTSDADKVDYFGTDGVRQFDLEINTTVLSINYYDSAGKNLRLRQSFSHVDNDDLNLAHSVFTLDGVIEYDKDGAYSREWHIKHGKIGSFEQKNDTVNGVRYGKVAYFYWQQKLDAVSFWNDPEKIDGSPDFVDREPVLKVVPPEVPVDYRQMHFSFGDDMLPVPPPQTDPHPG